MLQELAALPLGWHVCLAAVIGLMVGSFLNVVIYRYPERLKYQWSAQSHEWLHEQAYAEPEPPGLITPGSHCGHCQAPVKAWQNVPILSFLVLRGRCANCQSAIGWRYPLVEFLTAVLSALVVYRLGFNTAAGFAVLLTWVLVALTFIDIDHKLLPDTMVLPMLWLGLVLNLFDLYTDLHSAVIGAVAGYLFFWSVFQAFKLLTGKEGMGHGDFKLLALFGAWLGWQYLPQIILLSTVIGSIAGLALIILRKTAVGQTIPFGPYIALAGWIALLFGSEINAWYLAFAGLT